MMDKESFLSIVLQEGRILGKRCNEKYLRKTGAYEWLIKNTPSDFITISDKVKYQVYGGGYCLTCGTRTNVAASGKGFGSYCGEHFHDAKKGKVAHNRGEIDVPELIRLYVEEEKSIKYITEYYKTSFPTVHKILRDNGVRERTHSESIKLTASSTIKTNQEKRGVDYSFQSEEVKEKIKQTNLKRRGVEFPMQSPEVQDKARKTYFRRYNFTNPFNSDEVQERIRQERFDRIGSIHAKHSKLNPEQIELLNNPTMLQKALEQENVYILAKRVGLSHSCLRNLIQKHNLLQHHIFQSIPEKELSMFLDENDISYERNVRGVLPKTELDFVAGNLAIEMNGMYWHSELTKRGKYYHQNKSRLAVDKGMGLFHILESEWEDVDKKEHWKERILNVLKGEMKYDDAITEVIIDARFYYPIEGMEIVSWSEPIARDYQKRNGIWEEKKGNRFRIWDAGMITMRRM